MKKIILSLVFIFTFFGFISFSTKISNALSTVKCAQMPIQHYDESGRWMGDPYMVWTDYYNNQYPDQIRIDTNSQNTYETATVSYNQHALYTRSHNVPEINTERYIGTLCITYSNNNWYIDAYLDSNHVVSNYQFPPNFQGRIPSINNWEYSDSSGEGIILNTYHVLSASVAHAPC